MQFVRYLLVQILAYGIDMGVFALLISQFSTNPIVANLASKILAGLFAFAAHRKFTFEQAHSDRTIQQAGSYFILLALNIPLSSFLLTIALWVLPMPIVTKFLTDVVCVFLTYWLSKRFVFHSKKKPCIENIDGNARQ